eukprot:TRINITY_DN10265_c0_g1_i2.p1 TRINITY_DN10265_c0_g1~~TRINITY_DN10265_c0_g1_i2.p1  ORF type:complete len:354 (+),score=48.03 TRINITY_DN10265_c0_g1_i2:1122-2183(+)
MIVSRPKCVNPNNCDGGRVVALMKDVDGLWEGVQVMRGRHRNADSMFGDVMAISDHWLLIASKSTTYHLFSTAIVNVFHLNHQTNQIERTAGFRPKGSAQGDLDFGRSVAVAQFDALVGAPGYDEGSSANVGAVFGYRYRVDVDRWGRNPSITKAFDATAGDRFGNSVSINGSMIAVGNNPSDTSRQAVYVLTKSGYDFAHVQKIQQTDKLGFGWIVLLRGDELVVGSPADTNNGTTTNGGSVSILQRNSSNLFEESATLTPPILTDNRQFGHTVASHGNRLVVGTNTCPNGAPCPLFTKIGQEFEFVESFASGHPDGSDLFGTSVAVDDDDVVAGAPMSNEGGLGGVYSFSA